MKRFLLYDSYNDRELEADIETMLIESYLEEIFVETTRSVSEVMKKSSFWTSCHTGTMQNEYDIFVVCLERADEETWNLAQYVARNRPLLPLVIISIHDGEWLNRRFVAKTEKKPMCAASKQELLDKIRLLLTGCVSDQKQVMISH